MKLADRIPLVSVVTDPYYGFWKGWACDDVTLYLVASDEAQRQLIDYGIAPERIKVSGMPVHPKFAYPGETAARAARRALGLDAEKFTVFVNAGWEGGGNIPQIFRELIRGELDVQAIFLAGRNEQLRADAEALALDATFPIKVIGYSEHVEQLMSAANVMISKLGGLTTFEAFACRLPIIADAIPLPCRRKPCCKLLVRAWRRSHVAARRKYCSCHPANGEDTAHIQPCEPLLSVWLFQTPPLHRRRSLRYPSLTESAEQSALAELRRREASLTVGTFQSLISLLTHHTLEFKCFQSSKCGSSIVGRLVRTGV